MTPGNPAPAPGSAAEAAPRFERYHVWLYQIVLRRCRRWGLDGPDADDCASEVCAHVAMHSLPRFDPDRAPVKPYLIHCAFDALRDAVRRRRRERRLTYLESKAIDEDGRNSRTLNPMLDERIEQLAKQIVSDPQRFDFTDRQAEVIRALIEADAGETHQEIAARLGYADPSNLSHILRRIREHVSALADEHFDGWTDPGR